MIVDQHHSDRFLQPATFIRWQISADSFDAEQLPPSGDTLQEVGPPVPQADVRPLDQLASSPRDQDLVRSGFRRQPCPDVNREPTHLSRLSLAFTDVHACPDLDTEPVVAATDRPRASDGPGWDVEGGEGPVPSRIDLMASPPGDLRQNESFLPMHQLCPFAVP